MPLCAVSPLWWFFVLLYIILFYVLKNGSRFVSFCTRMFFLTSYKWGLFSPQQILKVSGGGSHLGLVLSGLWKKRESGMHSQRIMKTNAHLKNILTRPVMRWTLSTSFNFSNRPFSTSTLVVSFTFSHEWWCESETFSGQEHPLILID